MDHQTPEDWTPNYCRKTPNKINWRFLRRPTSSTGNLCRDEWVEPTPLMGSVSKFRPPIYPSVPIIPSRFPSLTSLLFLLSISILDFLILRKWPLPTSILLLPFPLLAITIWPICPQSSSPLSLNSISPFPFHCSPPNFTSSFLQTGLGGPSSGEGGGCGDPVKLCGFGPRILYDFPLRNATNLPLSHHFLISEMIWNEI